MDYHIYWLTDKSSKYHDLVAEREWRLQTQNEEEPFLLIWFQVDKRLSIIIPPHTGHKWNSRGLGHWPFADCIKPWTAATLNFLMVLPSKSSWWRREGSFTINCKVDNYPLKSHIADNVISELEAENLSYTKLSKLMQAKYEGALGNSKFCFNLASKEYLLKRIIINGLLGPTRQRMCKTLKFDKKL